MTAIYGKISLWKNEYRDNEKAPLFRGTIQDDDRNVIAEISLWKSDGTNPKAPVLTGTIKPPYKKGETSTKKPVTTDADAFC
jgi:hypothetical protein